MKVLIGHFLVLSSLGCLLPLLVLLERSHEGHLVLRSLETTVTKLGRGVDELQLDLLHGATLGVGQQGLQKNREALKTTY